MTEVAAESPAITHADAVRQLENCGWGDDTLEETLGGLGSPLPSYFRHQRSGGLLLQQVPSELASLLRYLWRTHPSVRSYLEIGVGSCGTLTVLLEAWRHRGIRPDAVVADNLSYPAGHEQRARLEWATARYGLTAFVGDTRSVEFSTMLAGREFDVIFVDGDHSFRGAMSDVFVTYPRLKASGTMILHDVTSYACPGVRRTLDFAKRFFGHCEVFSASDSCGIAVLTGRTGEHIPPTAYYSALGRRAASLAADRLSRGVVGLISRGTRR